MGKKWCEKKGEKKIKIVEKKVGVKKKSHQKVEKQNIIIIIIVSVISKVTAYKQSTWNFLKAKKNKKSRKIIGVKKNGG